MSRFARALVLATALLATASALFTAQEPARERAYRANNAGVARLEQFNPEEAAASFRQALAADRSLAIARLNLAIALFYANDVSGADTEARAAVAAMPGAPQAHYVRALIARARNALDEAADGFARVRAIDPRDVGAAVGLAQVYLQQRRLTEAAAIFREAVASEPYNATAAYGLAMALTRAGQAEAGRRAMERFQELRDSAYAITYSQQYLGQGRYAEAIASTGLERDLVDPRTPPARFVDATAALLGEGGVRAGAASLADVDADGDLDLVLVSASALRVRRSVNGRFEPGTDIRFEGTKANGIVAGDYDNDGRADLLMTGTPSSRLYRQGADGTFSDVTRPAGIPADAGATAAALADVDHDGDLDIFLASPNRLLRNAGKGRFADATAEARLSGSAPASTIIATDFDDRRDIDLLVTGPGRAPILFRNMRDGTFRDVAGEVRLAEAAGSIARAAGDVDKDGRPDFFLAGADDAGVVAMSSGADQFTRVPAPAGAGRATAALFLDYDNDGLLDLLALTPAGPRVWRRVAEGWSDVTTAAVGIAGNAGDPAASVAAGDIDGDGDTDALVRHASGRLAVWRNEGSGGRALRVRLEARVSNRTAIGAKVEMRAGSLRQKLETSASTPPAAPADLVFGLGARAAADVVRVLWPAGILQAETDPSNPITVTELDRKPSSCPYLFTWNGSRFEFVTDFMGGGEIGYWTGPAGWNTPDPDEYVRIRGDQLRPRDGHYEIRVTNELEEATFIDRLELVAVDHAEDVDVFPNEGLKPPPLPPFDVVTARGARPPVRAVDDHGHDMRPRIERLDRQYADDFARLPIRGYAEPHALTLDLGGRADDAVLLLTGWTDYAFSSDNVAAQQAGLAMQPPSLAVRDASGAWQTVIASIGFPVGRPQTVPVALRGRWLSASREVRITTNMRIYWDQILVDTSGGGFPVTLTRADAVDATHRWRGFSAIVTPDGREPFTYDYSRATADSPWKRMVGRYTREGDVLDLLRRTDDMFVISRPGDEIALSFDAAAFPPLRRGWTRTFLLYVDGYSKEMNLSSATPDALEPLPFHGMRRYPYGPDEHYPRSGAHRAYRERFNTRIVTRPLPPLEASQKP